MCLCFECETCSLNFQSCSHLITTQTLEKPSLLDPRQEKLPATSRFGPFALFRPLNAFKTKRQHDRRLFRIYSGLQKRFPVVYVAQNFLATPDRCFVRNPAQCNKERRAYNLTSTSSTNSSTQSAASELCATGLSLSIATCSGATSTSPLATTALTTLPTVLSAEGVA